jgi:tetratricopeptide (TPR) repeat protein
MLVAILAGLAQVSAAQAQSSGQSPLPDLDGGGAPRQAKPETQQPPASPPATRTPRLSPQPTDPTPPDPQAKADEDGKEQVAGPPPDTPSQRRRALDDLYAYLAATENARTSVPLVAAIERLWLFSGSDTIDVLMERVLKAVAEQRLELAAKLADTIVTLEPGFAEGWNRRALVAYLQGDQQNALDALSRALALEPSHFKALDGMAQIMRERGDKAAALKAYRKLLDVHPYWEGAQEAMEQLKREVEGDGI